LNSAKFSSLSSKAEGIFVTTATPSILPLSDAPEFADVCAAWSFGEWTSQVQGRTLDEAVTRYRQTAYNPDKMPATWVAMKDNRPAGMISLKAADHPDYAELTPWMGSLYVHPLYRNQGCGTALMEHVEQKAAQDFDFNKIYLFTGEAQDFYVHLGWKEIAQVRDPSGIKPEGKTLMMKEI